MMRGMADGHPFADLDANDDGAVELTRSGRTAASLSTCPVRPPSSVKRCYGTPNCIGGGTPGVGVALGGIAALAKRLTRARNVAEARRTAAGVLILFDRPTPRDKHAAAESV
jgi:hypothetical protein